MVSAPAVDSHAHVFNKKFSFATDAHYIPDENQQGSPTEFMDVLHAHGFSHGLLTGALPYGFDNSCIRIICKSINTKENVGIGTVERTLYVAICSI